VRSACESVSDWAPVQAHARLPTLALSMQAVRAPVRAQTLASAIMHAASDAVPMLQVQTLWSAIKQPAILYPAIFCFVWQATPSADSALFYFYNDALGFGPEFLGRVRLVGSVSALAGVWLFNTFLKRMQLRSIFKWTAITGTVLSFTQVRLWPLTSSAPARQAAHTTYVHAWSACDGACNASDDACHIHLSCGPVRCTLQSAGVAKHSPCIFTAGRCAELSPDVVHRSRLLGVMQPVRYTRQGGLQRLQGEFT
jgi:hypothetical protein